jgi:hypothetical protein
MPPVAVTRGVKIKGVPKDDMWTSLLQENELVSLKMEEILKT